MAIVIAVVALFVLYPIYYLFQAALDVGLPDHRPPTAYGFSNFATLGDYPAILLNTLMVFVCRDRHGAPVRLCHGVDLTRTNVPFRAPCRYLMTVLYYVTPLLGALAWSFLGAPESGFVNQLWRALGGEAPSSTSRRRWASPAGRWRLFEARWPTS